MASNTNIQLADLDFNSIKANFITYLQGQDVLKDYDYSGSALSTLLDILAYNTQYNAFYLNMVANEMFLDSAIQRESVVSQAKLLNYTPKSSIAPTAIVNMNVYSLATTTKSLTLPRYSKFISEAIDGVNYNFLSTDSITVNTELNTSGPFAAQVDDANMTNYILAAAVGRSPDAALLTESFDGRMLADLFNDGNVSASDALAYLKYSQGRTDLGSGVLDYIVNVFKPKLLSDPTKYSRYLVNAFTSRYASFNNVTLKQAVVGTNSFTVDTTANPTLTFSIPDADIDTDTLSVTVQQSGSNTYYNIYTLAVDYTTLTSNSQVYFLQEGSSGFYEIYFGDNNLGQSLTDGNIVNVSYLSTKGLGGAGANSFTLVDNTGNFGTIVVTPILAATGGKNKESIDSIKFQAPKAYAAGNRAVTKDDYITLIQQNKYGIALDAVNVWGGEEVSPPKYGKIFVAVKPTGGYSLSEQQKSVLINDVIKPISVLTVKPELITPEYIYLIVTANIVFDSRKTTLTSAQIQSLVSQGVINYCNANLNTFNSTFSVGDLIVYIQTLDKSIIGADFDLQLERRILPDLITSKTYSVEFGNPIRRYVDKSIGFPTSFSQYDINGNYYPAVYFEESNDATTSVSYITMTNGGSNYTAPTVTIYGDGSGATAYATVTNGTITGITVTSAGTGYTQALILVTDTTGSGASATATLKSNYTSLRTYYFDGNNIKNILTNATSTSSAGSVDYNNGIVTLTNFIPYSINSSDGYFRIQAYAAERVISSTFSRIITLDSTDPTAITVNVVTK